MKRTEIFELLFAPERVARFSDVLQFYELTRTKILPEFFLPRRGASDPTISLLNTIADTRGVLCL